MKRRNFILLLSLVLLFISCTSREEKLMNAVSNGNLNLVKKLTEEGVPVNIKNDKGILLFDLVEQSENDSLRDYLNGLREKILDARSTELLKNELATDLSRIMTLNIERKNSYQEYLTLGEELLSSVNSPFKLKDGIEEKHAEAFKRYQQKFKAFIHAKAELIDKVISIYISEDYLKDINHKDIRRIINIKILTTIRR